jgi:hypothetical protein
MAKHFRIECTEDDKITAVVRFEAPETDDDPIEAKLTIDCPPDSVPNLALGLKVALLAIEKYAELAAPVSGRLN